MRNAANNRSQLFDRATPDLVADRDGLVAVLDQGDLFDGLLLE
jgi:hypothetical protein